jgi:hypothetical protein
MGARWYDSYLNRWTQPDSIIPDWYNPQSLNRFAYGLNNPVKYRDPTGHRVVCDDATCGIEGTGTPGYTYSDEVEQALAQAAKSPTAEPYIDFARQNQLDIHFSLMLPDWFGFTRGESININSKYGPRETINCGEFSDCSIGNLTTDIRGEIPVPELIHEIVHAK